jgi:hypothetical protein
MIGSAGAYAIHEAGRVQALNRYSDCLLSGLTRANVPEADQAAFDLPGKPTRRDQLPTIVRKTVYVDELNFPAPITEKPQDVFVENCDTLTYPDLR